MELLLVIGAVGLAIVSVVAVSVRILRRARRSDSSSDAASPDDFQASVSLHRPKSGNLKHLDAQAGTPTIAEMDVGAPVMEANKGEEVLRKVVEKAFAEAEREAHFRAEVARKQEETLLLAPKNAHAEAEREAQPSVVDNAPIASEPKTQRATEADGHCLEEEPLLEGPLLAQADQKVCHDIEKDVRIEGEGDEPLAVQKIGDRQVGDDCHPANPGENQSGTEREASYKSNVPEQQPSSGVDVPAVDDVVKSEKHEEPEKTIHSAIEQKEEQPCIDTHDAPEAGEGGEPPTAFPETPALEVVPHAENVEKEPTSSTQEVIGPEMTIPVSPDELIASPKAPRQYRPMGRAPVRPKPHDPVQVTTSRVERDRAAPIELRLTFEHGGFCQVSLLPRRLGGMPEELEVSGSGNPLCLMALDEDWYQDVNLPDLGGLLRAGIEWAGSLPEGGQARSSLSGRELYVLASHSSLHGFVSKPRLILGEEHIVLCIEDRLREVQAAIAMTGSSEPVLLNSENGIPAGWIGLRKVVPRSPVAESLEGDILNALRPRPEVEIALEGGIRIDRQTWLSGFPPAIRLRGDTSITSTLTIDGIAASVGSGGSYSVPGWDSPGEHSIWCTSGTRTYTIRSGAEDWQPWEAYTWSLGEPCAGDMQSRPAVCGVLVHSPRVARTGSRPIVVPASNPVLIGAAPGEIETCRSRQDLRAGLCIGFPWFDPVWALPADSLQADKRTTSVRLVGTVQSAVRTEEKSSARLTGQRPRVRSSKAVHSWYTAILTAGSKGLRTEPSTNDVKDLWTTYKRYAKTLRRSNR